MTTIGSKIRVLGALKVKLVSDEHFKNPLTLIVVLPIFWGLLGQRTRSLGLKDLIHFQPSGLTGHIGFRSVFDPQSSEFTRCLTSTSVLFSSWVQM